MAGEIEQAGRTAEGVVQNAEAIANKAASMIRNACTAITTVLNHTGRATTVAYNQYKAISDKLINEYPNITCHPLSILNLFIMW